METRSMISFDWAIKRLLRSKANFEVLEGFLSELLYRKIIIKNIGESNSNQEHATDKYNRVDILVEADDHELVLIELQYDSDDDYFQRMLYGASKAIAEHISEGDPYSSVRKVYSINIVYFDLGTGDDYVYHGVTKFIGLHTHNELQLTAKQQQLYNKTVPSKLYPEYYIIKVRKFNDIAKNTLDEWIYYLKNNKIRDDFTAQGLAKARQVLALDQLSDAEKKQYWRHIEDNRIRNSEIVTAYTDGEIKGKEKGLVEGEAIGLEKGEAIGLEKGKAERNQLKAERDQLKAEKEKEQENMVVNCHLAGLTVETISSITGLTPEQITEILKLHGLVGA
jgi:predicted transposase/invertase (TIGR01784 family)